MCTKNTKMLCKYVRRGTEMIGCVVAISADQIGWSQCHLGKDVFSKKRAKDIAIGRAKKGTNARPVKNNKEKYSPIYEEFNVMCDRAQRYFR